MSFVEPSSAALRDAWRVQSAASGWAYPSDWPHESVDAVCDALAQGRDPWAAAERLGRTRAAAGISLAETLADVDTLESLAPGQIEQIRRSVSLGWAEGTTAPQVMLTDPMTGLVSHGYLQLRLGEVYRAAQADGVPVADSHAFVVCRVATSTVGLGRRLPMVIAAEAVRSIFDGGQTHAILSDTVMVALCERTDQLPKQAALAHSFAQRLMDADEQANRTLVRLWIESLPTSLPLACELLTDLAR